MTEVTRSVEVRVTTKARMRWDYAVTSPGARRIFNQAKGSTWDPETAVDWDTPVEFGAPTPAKFGQALLSGRLPFDVPEDRRHDLQWHIQAWMLSQFLHGEQGALLAAGQLVETAPELDWKLCAAAQALDEAKHVEVFARYLTEKLDYLYPVNRELEQLLLDVVRDSRWDVTYLGMQVLIEGAALGSFGVAKLLFFEPLSRDIVELVLRDEARHVGFGMIALTEVYPDLTTPERTERLEFVKTALSLLRSRYQLDDVWDRVGLPRLTQAQVDAQPFFVAFRRKGMSRIPPLLRRLGLWDDDVARLLDVR